MAYDDTRAREADTPPARTASQAPAWWAVISLAAGQVRGPKNKAGCGDADEAGLPLVSEMNR